MSGNLSLYFHVPFCVKKCPYCHFYSEKYSLESSCSFLENLAIEWEQKQPLLQGKKIVSIYFGGGTPTLIGPQALEFLLKKISFDSTTEITIETNPESTTPLLLHDLHSLGINRLSIGVQSFNDSSLLLLKRRHTAKEALKTIEDARKAGFSNISIDLMYDLPHQTLSDWRETLSYIPNLPITHISLYNLTIEPDTFFHKKRLEILPFLPKEKQSLSMLQDAVTAFENAGFARYEISAFARDDLYSRHNVGYWKGREYLGLGPSAHSYFHGKRFKNVSNLQQYHAKLKENLSPIDFEETLSPLGKTRESFALTLRLIEGIDLEKWEEEREKSLYNPLDKEGLDILHSLCNEGLLEKKENRFKLTKKGLLFYDTVAERIIL